MKRILESQKFFIVLSVLYIVTGIVILVWPGITLDFLGKAVGIGLLVIGLTHVILYFIRDHMSTIMQMDLTTGVIYASLGAFILMHTDFVEMAIPFAVSILLLIGAMTKVQYSIDMHRLRVKRWYLLLIAAILIGIVGVLLLYNPFKTAVLITMIAVSLIVDGFLNICSILFISSRMKKIARGKMPAPDGAGPAGPGTPNMDQYQRIPQHADRIIDADGNDGTGALVERK